MFWYIFYEKNIFSGVYEREQGKEFLIASASITFNAKINNISINQVIDFVTLLNSTSDNVILS